MGDNFWNTWNNPTSLKLNFLNTKIKKLRNTSLHLHGVACIVYFVDVWSAESIVIMVVVLQICMDRSASTLSFLPAVGNLVRTIFMGSVRYEGWSFWGLNPSHHPLSVGLKNGWYGSLLQWNKQYENIIPSAIILVNFAHIFHVCSFTVTTLPDWPAVSLSYVNKNKIMDLWSV